MKIRTQLLASVAVSLALATAIGLGVWVSARQQLAAADEQERAQAAAREIAGLLVLTQEYTLHLDNRVAEQWRRRHATLTEALAAPSPYGAEVTAELQQQARLLQPLFARLTELTTAQQAPLAERLKQLLVDRLLGGIQAMSDGAYRWSREAAQAQRGAERRFHVAAMLAIAVMVLLTLAQGVFMARRVLRPLRSLERATESIERGDLSERTHWAPRRDELGDLARRFEAMTQALRQRTEQLEASNASLDREAGLRRASEQRMRTITDNLPALISQFDREQRYLFANAAFKQLFGVEPQQIVGQTLRQFRGEEVYAQLAPHVATVLGGQRATFESHAVIDGRLHHFLQNYVPELSPEGEVLGFYSVSLDITEAKLAREQIQTSERRLRDITDNLPVLISYVDEQQRFRFCNGTFIDWMGIEPTEMLGRTVAEVTGPELYGQRRVAIERALAGERVEFEVSSTALGRARHLHTTYVPDVRFDGTVAGIYTLSTDISELKAVEQQLSQLARFDTLTGLANRHQLNEKLPEVVARARRSREAVALMYLDVDRFKSINDAYGHAAGDAVLKEFARRVRSSVRATDTVARLSGDEFVVVLEGLHAAAEPQFVARKIIAAIERPFELGNGLVLQVSTSVGIAFSPDVQLSPEGLLARADAALYEAKAAGRNTFRLATV
jgi:diguanylate cyclase (GGDEF)-like protein/PAS domain S-box-containing protein